MLYNYDIGTYLCYLISDNKFVAYLYLKKSLKILTT